MSSKRKDARWQLALDIADDLGVNWDTSDYAVHMVLLDFAEDILEYFPNKVEPLATRFSDAS